jgi:hypothetical protein
VDVRRGAKNFLGKKLLAGVLRAVFGNKIYITST